MDEDLIINTNNKEETIEAGYQFAEKLEPGNIVLLYGELGSGKTEFTKGICAYYDIDDIITSPTFTIINQYFAETQDGLLPIFHIDLYRIKSQKELLETGFFDFINDVKVIKIIEWAEKIDAEYSCTVYKVEIAVDEQNEYHRTISISKM